jgi:hypothetical protein
MLGAAGRETQAISAVPHAVAGSVPERAGARAARPAAAAGAVRDLAGPPFAAIANQEGLTEETLATWLRGAHNYPAEMNFYLNERQVNELVAYFLSLKSPNYRRPPD